MCAATARPIRRLRSHRWRVLAGLLVALLSLVVYANRPIRAHYYLSQGRRALSDGQSLQALASLQVAYEIEPMNSETAFWLARACRKTGDLAGLRRYLGESKQLGFPDPKRLEREWWLFLAETGRIKEVERHLAGLLMSPGDDGSEICDAFSKGFCLNLMFGQAQQLLDVWSTEFPRDYRPFLRRGQIHAGNKQWALAIGELREAQQRAPRELAVQRELGHCLYKNDQIEEAEQQLNAVIQDHPLDVPSLMLLAQMAFDRSDHKTTQGYLDRLVAVQPYDFPARLLLAKVHLAMGDAARSIAIGQSLVEEWPEDLSAHYVLAQALRAAGRADDAKRHFVIHGELDKNWSRIEAMGREMNQHPTDPRMRYELGLLLLRHVSRSEGVAYLESVFQFVPTYPDAHRALAEYYGKSGNPTLAAQHQQLAGTNFSAASTFSSFTSRERPE